MQISWLLQKASDQDQHYFTYSLWVYPNNLESCKLTSRKTEVFAADDLVGQTSGKTISFYIEVTFSINFTNMYLQASSREYLFSGFGNS